LLLLLPWFLHMLAIVVILLLGSHLLALFGGHAG
jgi:hypothetical protein